MYTNCNSTDISIEDLAKLARETCVYRGSSQGLKKVLPAPARRQANKGRLSKWFALFRGQ